MTATAPLEGIRVIEVGSTVAGPFCGRLLADFGAEVIKVEPPTGDLVRSMGKQFHNHSLYAASIFRNKAMVAIDLRSPEGRGLIRDLSAAADVLIENFRPGRMEEWGLGYEQLSRVNPRLVMARISGFGQDGPFRERPGYGVIGEAMSGLRHVTGDPDRPPSRVAVSLTDYITGLYTAFGILLALLARHRSGRGQVIDSALYESAFSFMEPWIPAYEKLGHVATRSGSRLPESTPNNLYPTSDHEFIHITAPSNGTFQALARAMGVPDLANDPRFSTSIQRSVNALDLDELVARWTSSHRLETLESVLVDAGVPASKIFTIADIFAHPLYEARGSIVAAPDDEMGTVAMSGVVPRLSDTPGAVHWAGRPTGRDTCRVLKDLLGASDTQIDGWLQAGVIANGDRGTGVT